MNVPDEMGLRIDLARIWSDKIDLFANPDRRWNNYQRWQQTWGEIMCLMTEELERYGHV